MQDRNLISDTPLNFADSRGLALAPRGSDPGSDLTGIQVPISR